MTFCRRRCDLFAAIFADVLARRSRFHVNAVLFGFCEALQIGNVVVSFIGVDVMNFVVPFGHFAVVINPNRTVDREKICVMPLLVFPINDAVKFLMSIVDDFNGRRRSQITFENVEAVVFKIVFGMFAQNSESGNYFGCKFHLNHYLQISRRIDKMISQKCKEFPAWLLLLDNDILPQRDFLFNDSREAFLL